MVRRCPAGLVLRPVRESQIEAALEAILACDLRVHLLEMPSRRQDDLWGKGQRRDHGPWRDSPVVRAVRHAARHIIEEAALDASDLSHRPTGSIARGQPPEVLAVAHEGVRILNRVLLLDVGRSPAVLEVINALVAHEDILNPTDCLLYTSDAADEEDSVDLG